MEIITKFNEMTQPAQAAIIAAHSAHLRTNSQRISIKKIFEMCNPTIVTGVADGKPYCRIANDSVPAMKLLVKEYIR